MRETYQWVVAALVALLCVTQVAWGMGQKPLVVKQKTSDTELYLTPLLKEECQTLHIRYRALEETEWHSHVFDVDEMQYYQGEEYFVLKVEKAGNYIIEYRADELYSLLVKVSNFQPTKIISWGDVVWGDVPEEERYMKSYRLFDILPDAGNPNLSQKKKLWSFTDEEFNNPNLLGWDVSNVEYICFRGARAFNQDLGGWKLSKCKRLDLDHCGLSVENYSASLIGWAQQEDIAHGVRLHVNRLVYNSEAVAAREKLIKEKGWQIDGDRLLTSEHLFQFPDSKVVIYGDHRDLPLLANGLDLTALRWNVEPEGFIEIETLNNGIRIRRKETLGTCTIRASLPAQEGAHPALEAICEVEVVAKSGLLVTIMEEGKEIFRETITVDNLYESASTGFNALPNKTYELKFTSPDPTEVFELRDFERYSLENCSIISKGRNTWELKTFNWDISKESLNVQRFGSIYPKGVTFGIYFPYVRVPRMLNLLRPIAEEEKISIHNNDGSLKLECSIESGGEFLSVTPEGQLSSKAAGTARVSVTFAGYPESKKVFEVRVLDQLPIEVDGVELTGDKLRMVVGGYLELSTPLRGWFIDTRDLSLPDGVVGDGTSVRLTDASAHGKTIEVSAQEDASSPNSNRYYGNLNRTLTIEVVKSSQPLTALDVRVKDKIIEEGATIVIPYGETVFLHPRFTPAATEERAIAWQYVDPHGDNQTSIGNFLSFGRSEGLFRVTAKSIAHPELVRNFCIEVQAKPLSEPNGMILYDATQEPIGDCYYLTPGDVLSISVKFTPEGARAKPLQYSEWNPYPRDFISGDQVSNSEFYVRALEKENEDGGGEITIRSHDGDRTFYRDIDIRVVSKIPTYSLHLNNMTELEVNDFPPSGSISRNKAGVWFHINNPTHKTLKVTADNGAQIKEDKENRNSRYYVQLAYKNATITITEVSSCKVTLTKSGEGELAIKDYKLEDLATVAQGAELMVDVEAEYGYTLESLMAGTQDILTTKKFTVTENVEIKAVFRKTHNISPTFIVTLKKEGEGTLAIPGYTTEQLETVVEGSKLRVTADAATGYILISLTAAGENILSTKEFTVTGYVEVKAVFMKKEDAPKVAISLAQEGEGTLAIDGYDATALNAVAMGTELTVIATPADGYSLTSLMVGTIDILTTKKFTVAETVEVKAVFTKNAVTPKDFKVTLIQPEHGTLAIKNYTAEALNAVAENTELEVIATPEDATYELKELKANGVDILATKKFTVTGAVTVKAVFTKNGGSTTFAVTLAKEGEGTLAIEGYNNETLKAVAEGTELTVIATPKEGYTLTSLTVGTQDILATKKFTVTEAVTVKAVFKKKGNNGGGNNGGGNGGGSWQPQTPQAVEDAVLASVVVAPNPFSVQLRILNPEGVSVAYELVNLAGVVLRTGVVAGVETTVDTADLSAGLYFVRFVGENGASRTVRVVKY